MSGRTRGHTWELTQFLTVTVNSEDREGMRAGRWLCRKLESQMGGQGSKWRKELNFNMRCVYVLHLRLH